MRRIRATCPISTASGTTFWTVVSTFSRTVIVWRTVISVTVNRTISMIVSVGVSVIVVSVVDISVVSVVSVVVVQISVRFRNFETHIFLGRILHSPCLVQNITSRSTKISVDCGTIVDTIIVVVVVVVPRIQIRFFRRSFFVQIEVRNSRFSQKRRRRSWDLMEEIVGEIGGKRRENVIGKFFHSFSTFGSSFYMLRKVARVDESSIANWAVVSFSTRFHVFSEVGLDMILLIALFTSQTFRSLRMFSPPMSPQLIKSHKNFITF